MTSVISSSLSICGCEDFVLACAVKLLSASNSPACFSIFDRDIKMLAIDVSDAVQFRRFFCDFEKWTSLSNAFSQR